MHAITVIAILAVIIPLVIYSLRLSYKVETDRQFFQGVHKLSAEDLFDTLAASWLMLGNVFLANLFFGMMYGWKNFWLILTWFWAFKFMMRHVGAVNTALKTHDTLHSFLSTSFGSDFLRKMAAFITAFTGFGIIALEIIVVMALLVPVAGVGSPWLPFVAGFAILLTLGKR
jgi:Na+/proline symporter